MAGVGFQTLRHSAAVGWLEGNVHIKAVADLLGRSSIAVTGDVYGHTSTTWPGLRWTAGVGHWASKPRPKSNGLRHR